MATHSTKIISLLRLLLRFVFLFFFVAVQGFWENASVSAAPSERPPANLPPSVSLNVPAEAFIGETITFTVTFDNVNTVPGYGPLIDLIIPRNGADGAQNTNPPLDGLTFVSATYLGVNVEKTVLTFPGSGGVTCVAHPYMVDNTGNPVQVCGNAGDTFVALRLPFGSFTPAQPPLVVDVTVSMSNLADLGTPLTIQARGGYQFGYTPLNDWCCGDDPSLSLSGWTSGSVTPTLFTLSKSYSGPEDETATGPNFPRRYTIIAQIAAGQTMTSFTLTDVLPNNMQFVSLVSTNPGGASCTTPSTSTPGGTLSCTFASVSGTASMTFEYYIPLRDGSGGSVINPSTGDDALSCNNASGGGTWTPLDPRDTGGTFTQDPSGCEHTLTDKSVAIQKGVSVVGGGGAAPGKYLQYTLDFQISDFFAFNNVVIADVISDGQHFDNTFAPTLEINGNTYTLSAAPFNAANYDVTCNYTGGPGPECTANDPAANDGVTTLLFRVSDEIIARGQNGKLIGGCVPTSGTGGTDPNCASYDDGPTTGRIVFRTLIQQDFTDTFPSGDPSVDQGDTLNNTVDIAGDLLSTSDVSTPTGYAEADGSAASVNIGRGPLAKSVYAINGSTSFSLPVEVKPGDEVTYRLTYILPTGDVEDLAFDDYLPLPVFHVGDPDEDGAAGPAWTFNPTVSAAAPPAGVAKFGPSDTFYAYSSIVPTVSSNVPNNRLDFFYGNFDGTNEQPYTVDILFTVTVSDDPFADRLYLTNQAHAFEGSTNAGTADANAIVQIILTEPVLTTAKSAVASDNSTALFTPPLPISFTAPGSPGPRWSGTISSSTLPIDSDISGVDAGDLVTFAIFIENTGSSINGAFDIVIQDVFDSLAFEYPTPGDPTSINLQIYYGNGTGPISYTKPDDTAATPADLFSGGIKLVDPVGQGVCQAHDPNSGNNVIVILYDLRLKSNIAPGVYTNTGSLTNYSGSEGGPNFLPQPESDDAEVTVSNPASAKALVSTEINDAYNGASQVVIGEIATYTVTLTIPEGVTPNAQLVDTLDMGLAFVALDSVTLSSSLSITGSTTPTITDSGRTVTFNFGDITNTDTDNTTSETIVLTYRVVTLNIISNQSGWGLNNRVRFSWTGGSVEASAPNVTVIEPTINTTKSVLPASADAGDTVTFTVTLSNPASGSTTAYDVTWSDAVPTGLNYVPGTLALGACTASTPLTLSEAGAPTLSGSGGLFQPGESCTITFQATVDYSVSPGQAIPNTAQTRWTSMSGTVADRSGYNSDSDERTGEDGLLNSGALNDYRTEGTATVTINQVAPQKSIVATSEAHTVIAGGTERVVVGEIVRYRLVVQWPEGTSLNAMLRDNLPTGLQFLDADPPVNTKVAFVCNGGAACMSSSTLGSGPVVSGNETNVGSITPSYVLPDAAVSSSETSDNDTYGSGADPYFKFGDLVNNDSDADQEFVVLEFNALVLNISGNQSGTNRDNSFTVRINGADRATSSAVRVTIAEPNLTLSKSILPPAPTDAGDTFTYRLVITNTSSGNNAATAFDLELTDTFDAYLTNPVVTNLATTQPPFCNGGTLAALSSLVAGSTVTVTASCLDPGRTITVEIAVTVASNAPAGYLLPNTGNLTYTSLPGAGTSPNPTGGTTPGGSGAGNGERNGQDGVGGALNDYAARSTVNTTLAVPQVDKLDPSPTSYVIGEQVTFNIRITLPEGVTPNLQALDNLPAGLQYVSHQVITTAAASGGLLAADYNGAFTNDPPAFTCSGTCASGDDITLDFGNTTTAADNVANNNSFLVRVVARVLNVAGNQNGTTLTNTATVSWTGGSASDSTNITLREPELDIQKAADDTAWLYGQTVTYTITVSHLGSSTADAYDLIITDTIPAGLTYVAGSIAASAGCTGGDGAAPSLTWTCATLALGNTATLTYQVTVNSPPTPPFLSGDDTVTNTADLTWTSLSGVNPDERTGSGGVNDYADSDTETGGLEQYYALGNRVWFDTNNNAQIDAGEVGVDGVTVELYAADGSGNPTGAVLATDVTSGGGYYHFDYLLPGDYVVVLPASNFASGGVLEGYWSSLTSRADSGAISETPAPDADNDVDSDDNGTLQTSGAFNGAVLSQAVTLGGAAEPTGETDLEAGVGQGAQPDNRANMTVDFGFYRLQIGNLVFEDINVNGNYDSGTDNVLGGVTVELLSGDGSTVLATTTTSPGGLYLFSGQPAGNYIVRVTAPSGMISAIDTYAPADTANPDVNVDNNDNGVGTAGGAVSSNQLTMQGGEAGANIIINNASGTTTDPTVDFGFVYPYALGNRVWFDTNNNSQIDFGTEVGVDGVVVNLYRNDGAGTYVFVATDTTANGGYYLFDNLLPGEYIVALPASNFAAGGVLNGYWSSATTLSGAGAITETAAPDPDNDTDSDDNGTLQTSGAFNGQVISLPVTLGPTGLTEPLNESDLESGVGQGVQPDGRANMTVDFGFYRVSVGNLVYTDGNENGNYEGGPLDAPLPGVTVRLYASDGTTEIPVGPDGILGTADDAPGGMATNASGEYRFDGLPQGDYIVRVVAPPSTTSAIDTYNAADSANPNTNADNNDNGLGTGAGTVSSAVFTLTPGSSGALNNNIVTQSSGSTHNPTLDFGFIPQYALGNRVWFDTNNNGQIDAGEAGIDGVTVELYAADGSGNPTGAALATDTTANGGYYLFNNLASGRYVVVIPASNFTGVLNGYWSSGTTRNNDGSLTELAAPGPDNDVDSDDNGQLNLFGSLPGAVASRAVTLGLGPVEPTGETDLDGGNQGQPDAWANMTVDFGFYIIRLGNQVWNDADNSGLLDGAETGMDGVTVELWSADGSTLLDTTTTSGGGIYTFSGLPQGSYIVRLPEGNFQGTGALRDYYSSAGPANAYEPAPNPDINLTDSDDNGTEVGSLGFPGGYIQSGVFALTPAAEQTFNNADGSTTEFRVDFGVRREVRVNLSAAKDDGVDYYLPGGTLIYTIVIRNDGPADVTGATVADNIPSQIASWEWTCVTTGGATCAGSGGFISTNFTDTVDMPVDSTITYTVNVNIAAAATGTLDNTVTVTPPTGVIETDDSDNSDTDSDLAAILSIDKDDGVTVVSPGQVITYTLTVSNTGTLDLSSIRVTDTLPAEVTFQSAVPAPTSVAGGTLTWTGISLAAGASTTIQVTVRVNDDAVGPTITNNVTVEDTTIPGLTDSDDDTDIILTIFSKALVATNQAFTDDPAVAIGEILTYQITITVPAGGSMSNLTVTDILDRGLAFVECASIAASSADITTTLPGGFNDACNDPGNPQVFTEPAGSTNPADRGRRVVFNLGTVSNSGATDGAVTIRYTVAVLDNIENQDGVRLNNSATLAWDSGSLSAAAAEVVILEPDFALQKTVNQRVALPGTTLTFTLAFGHTAQSNIDAFDVVLTDILPPGLTYVPGSLTILSGPPGGVTDDTAAPTLTVTWASFPLLTGGNRTTAVVQFQAVFDPTAGAVTNAANLEWTSLPGDVSAPQSPYNDASTERYYDPASDVNVYGVQDAVTIYLPAELPETGFAPGVVTAIPPQPADKAYSALGDLWLEIPKLGVKLSIVGIPAKDKEWDLTWLWNQAGWLEGTAYPTHAGNSALTAHAILPNGEAGPFFNLGNLMWGDRIIVHLGGQKYIYEVRQTRQVSPYSFSPLRHEDLPWLTLITCREYDPVMKRYRYRVIVRAVLIQVVNE